MNYIYTSIIEFIVHAGIKNHEWKIKSMTSNNAVLITRKKWHCFVIKCLVWWLELNIVDMSHCQFVPCMFSDANLVKTLWKRTILFLLLKLINKKKQVIWKK